MNRLRTLASTLLLAAAGACTPKTTDWGSFDVLKQSAPRPRRVLGNQPVDDETYRAARRLGERWFRETTFGNERTITDVLGLLGGSVSVPCMTAGKSARCEEPVLPHFARAVDALDGVPGNLFSGNGGGVTSDLVLSFPRGTTLHGIPVPERVHTGLDVEAGSAWPIGFVLVPARAEDTTLPYLVEPSALGGGPANPGKGRLGLTCATCHFSLDVDFDGRADLRSAWSHEPTQGSPYRPEHAWAIGNQDLKLGWLIAFSKNPLAVFSVFSGSIGGRTATDARAFARWVKENYRAGHEIVQREVVRGMLIQPRGFADDTPDGLFNAIQVPSLYTRGNHPFNFDGNFVNAEDRNNGVWTIALDPTELVSLCNDRAGTLASLGLTARSIYHEFSAMELAELQVARSPAVLHDPSAAPRLRDDILGTSDGVPGLLDVESTLLVPGLLDSIPDDIRAHADNTRSGRNRAPASFGGDARHRSAVLGYGGVRVRTPPNIRNTAVARAWVERSGVNPDELVSQSVSLMLDSLDPPPNRSPWLSGAAGRALVERGKQLFASHGCADCHRGPFFTDNVVHPLEEIGTQPARAEFSRLLQQFLAPTYDPRSGKAVHGGFLELPGLRRVGYKTLTLRYVWGSAPYLHDGGVGVAAMPNGAVASDLRSHLARADKVHGTGPILSYREAAPESHYRADAALSLQGLLLRSERKRILRGNLAPVMPVPGTERKLAAADLGIEGIGHAFYVDDEPGGDAITALVAFLLALDDEPGILP
jgi:hypothetical protein